MKASKQCLVVVDEYGDGILPQFREGELCLSPEEQELLRLDMFSKLQCKEIIISVHPCLVEQDSKVVDGLNINKTFELHFLSNILRNSGNICKYFKDFGDNTFASSKHSTVLGYKPEVVRGDVDNPSYYKESIDAIKKKAGKFICMKRTKFNFSLFEEQLMERAIKLFRYDDVEHDSDKLKEFIKSDSGCLLTNYALARGTESISLLNYQDEVSNSSMLRCAVNLVECIPQGSVEVSSSGPGILVLRGYHGDPALYTRLQVELNKEPYNKYNKFVFLLGKKLPPGVAIIKKEYKFPNSKKEFDEHLDCIEQGCIIYYNEGRSLKQGFTQLCEWLRGTSVPLIYSRCAPNLVDIVICDGDTMFPLQ